MLAATALGQPQKEAEIGQSINKDTAAEQPIDLDEQLQQVISLEVSDLRLVEFVQEIKKQVPMLNVLVEKSVEDVQAPQVKLRRVTAYAALESLYDLTGRQVRVDYGGDRAYVIIRANDDTPLDQKQIEVLSVRAWLTNRKDEFSPFEVPATDNPEEANGRLRDYRMNQLTDAIKMGVTLLQSRPVALDFRLHESTGLLFVRGRKSEVELVRRIVSELQPSGGMSSGVLGGGAPPGP